MEEVGESNQVVTGKQAAKQSQTANKMLPAPFLVPYVQLDCHNKERKETVAI